MSTDRVAAPKKVSRSSPTIEVDMFTYGTGARDVMPSNFIENTKKLSKYCIATYGVLGKMIKLRAYPTIPRTVIDVNHPDYAGMSDVRI